MKIEVIFLDDNGKKNKNKTLELSSNYENRYILQRGNFIQIEGVDYCINAVKGIYEEGSLVQIKIKVQPLGEF